MVCHCVHLSQFHQNQAVTAGRVVCSNYFLLTKCITMIHELTESPELPESPYHGIFKFDNESGTPEYTIKITVPTLYVN